MKKQFLLLAACFLLLTKSFHAQNLVNNYSLESYVSCPSTGHQLLFATGWVASLNSPDYFNACANGLSNYGVPSNELGYQYAASGNAYAGALCYGGFSPVLIHDLREYCTATLAQPLAIGVKYYVSFKATLANTSSHAVNNIGAKFLVSPVFPLLISNNAEVYTTSVINDTLNWTLVQGSFVADTNYNYISIGNHYNDSNTTVTYLQPVTMGYNAYYFIDNVCISTDSLTCNATTGIQSAITNPESAISIYPNPAYESLVISDMRTGKREIEIYDLFGRRVFESATVNGLSSMVNGHSSVTIDISNLSPGIYFLKAGNEARKFVKE